MLTQSVVVETRTVWPLALVSCLWRAAWGTLRMAGDRWERLGCYWGIDNVETKHSSKIVRITIL